jgi:hypothetical protein
MTTKTSVRHAHETPLSRRAAMDQDLMTEETKILEISSYNPLNLARSHIRLAGFGMVAWPWIVSSSGGSAVLLELGMRFESYRTQAIVQVAPAFTQNDNNYNNNNKEEEEESSPPPPPVVALKVVRVTLCRDTVFDYIPSPCHEEEGRKPRPALCFHRGFRSLRGTIGSRRGRRGCGVTSSKLEWQNQRFHPLWGLADYPSSPRRLRLATRALTTRRKVTRV